MIEPLEFTPLGFDERQIFPKETSLDLDFDVFNVKLETITNFVLSLLKSCDLYNLTNESEITTFVHHIKEQHKPNEFRNFLLCVDHCQFYANLISSIPNKTVKELAVFFFLLSLYCDESPETVIFKAESLCTLSPISQNREEFYQYVGSLSSSTDSFNVLFDKDIIDLLAAISRYSYLSRSIDVTNKFVNLRFLEDKEENAEIQHFIIEFEVRSFIVPCCGEFLKRGISMYQIRKQITSNASSLTHSNY